MLARRRPLARAAMVGGTAYYAGKRSAERSAHEAEQEARIQELEAQGAAPQGSPSAPAPASSISSDALAQLERLAELKEKGVLTQEEFDVQKRRLLEAT